MAIARLQEDLQEHRSLRSTTGLFQDAPDHKSFEELEDMAHNRGFWRSLVVAIEPEDTLELQRRKKSRRTRSSGGSHRSHRTGATTAERTIVTSSIN